MSKKSKTHDESKRDRFMWTPQMDDAFVDALYHQHTIGNRVDGVFTTIAYDNIVKELSTKLGMDITKDKVKHRLKTIKTHFNECYDLFKFGTSGFAWSPMTKMWCAEPHVWKTLIESKPKAEKWKTTPINHYDKLLELFSKDRATGAGAETAKEKRRRWATNSVDPVDSMLDIDRLIVQNEVTLENNNRESDDSEPIVPPEAFSEAPISAPHVSSKRKKKQVSEDEKEVEVIKLAIESVAEAIREGNSIYEKFKKTVYSEKDVFYELTAIGLEGELLDDAYLFLTGDADKMRQFMGCPSERRKGILERMMYGRGV